MRSGWPNDPAVPAVAQEIEDLEGQAARLADHQYDASDRKYGMAKAMGTREGKEMYLSSIDRARRNRKR